jgi:hypothetical protein
VTQLFSEPTAAAAHLTKPLGHDPAYKNRNIRNYQIFIILKHMVRPILPEKIDEPQPDALSILASDPSEKERLGGHPLRGREVAALTIIHPGVQSSPQSD